MNRFSNFPNKCFETLEASGGFWRLLDASGGFWRLLEASGGLWRLLEASGLPILLLYYYALPYATTYYYLLLCATIYYYTLLYTTRSYYIYYLILFVFRWINWIFLRKSNYSKILGKIKLIICPRTSWRKNMKGLTHIGLIGGVRPYIYIYIEGWGVRPTGKSISVSVRSCVRAAW